MNAYKIVNNLLESNVKDLLRRGAAFAQERPVAALSVRALRQLFAPTSFVVKSAWRPRYAGHVDGIVLLARPRRAGFSENVHQVAEEVAQALERHLIGTPAYRTRHGTYVDDTPTPQIVLYIFDEKDEKPVQEGFDPKAYLARLPKTAEEALRLCGYTAAEQVGAHQEWLTFYPLANPFSDGTRVVAKFAVFATVQWPESQHGDVSFTVWAYDTSDVPFLRPTRTVRSYIEHREQALVQIHTALENVAKGTFTSSSQVVESVSRVLDLSLTQAWRRNHPR